MIAPALLLCALLAAAGGAEANRGAARGSSGEQSGTARIERLPAPEWTEPAALDSLLRARASVRSFSPDTLDSETAAALLWAAHGITREDRFAHHTIPSAGALFPLEVHWVTARGVARYDPRAHALLWRAEGDSRVALARAALGQPWVAAAPATLVLSAVPERTRVKYGERGDRYVWIEVGCAAQNVLLAAEALGLGAVPVGAFDDEAVAGVLDLPEGERACLLLPVGRPEAPPPR